MANPWRLDACEFGGIAHQQSGHDERLAGEDVHVAVAARLYESKVVSLGKAARIAELSTSEFIDRLGALQIPVIRYSAEELERELAAFG